MRVFAASVCLGVLTPLAAAEVVFSDKMDDISKWTQSSWKSSSEMAEFELQASQNNPNKDDTALATTQDARFYGASTTFPKEISFKGKSLLVQYEVTYDKDPDCGGGYLKLGPKMEDAKKFGDPTEYALMFGPDKCGHTKRTHLILNYKGRNVLKKNDMLYKQAAEGISSLYRVTISPENKVKVNIDGEEVFTGEIGENWSVLEAKEIDDPDDKKPADWVDDAMMDDPEDKKPADWVEEKEIVDKDAKQPEDWDKEEDGEWEAPMIANPDFKGEWKAKRISNPAYKGVWAPKKIANPKYEDDTELYLLNKKDLGFVGFDLWQVKAGSLFDNLIIATGKDEKELVKEADERVAEWKKLVEEQKKIKDSTTTTTTTAAPAEPESKDADESEDKDDEEGKDSEDL